MQFNYYLLIILQYIIKTTLLVEIFSVWSELKEGTMEPLYLYSFLIILLIYNANFCTGKLFLYLIYRKELYQFDYDNWNQYQFIDLKIAK